MFAAAAFRNCLCILICCALLLTGFSAALAQTAPSDFQVVSRSSSSLTVSWQPGSGIASYGINYSNGGGDERHAGSTGGSSFTIEGLKPGTRYTIFLDWPGPLASSDYLRTSGQTLSQPPKDGEPLHQPPPVTCPFLEGVSVSGYGVNTQCKLVGAAGVGIPALMAQGLLAAVDVFGELDAELRLCFQQAGRLKFLDAATSPRAESDLAAETSDGMTCGRIDRPGTVVLLAGEAEAVAAPVSEAPPASEPPPAPLVPTGNAPYICQLLSGDIINLRAAPAISGEVLAEIPYQTMLQPWDRAGDWFQVAYDAQRGWVHKSVVMQSLGCNSFSHFEGLPEQAPGSCQLRAGTILNLRADASTDSDILTQIPNRAELQSDEKAGDWYQVEYQGALGWVHGEYLLRSGDCE